MGLGVAVAKRFYEKLERRRGLSSAGIVEVIPRKGWTPVFEDPDKLTLSDLRKQQVIRQACQAAAGLCHLNHHCGVVADELPVHAQFYGATVLFELPGVETAQGGQALQAFLHISLRKYDEARQFIEKAMAFGPNISFIPAVAANIELFCNRPQAMIPLLKLAMRLCPIYPAWYLGDLAFAYLLMNRLEDAVATAEASIKIDPDYIYNYHVLAIAHAELEQPESAGTAIENMLRIEPKMSIRTFRNSQPYADEAVVDRMIAAFRKAGLPE